MPPVKRSSGKAATQKSADHQEAASQKSGPKKKPAFELPPDTGAQESASGWVYRESESVTVAATDPAHAGDSSSNSASTADRTYDGMFAGPDTVHALAMASEAMVLGAASISLAVFAMMRLVEASIAAGNGFFPGPRHSA
jgi:hypothetical protein